MPGKIYQYLADDHTRLDALLERAASHSDGIEPSAYAEFRAGLLKHISMEEKILLPAAQRLRGGEPLPITAKLRLDHGALAALLVPTPTPSIVTAIRTILKAHNPIEEGPGGLYEQCEALASAETDQVLNALRNAAQVRVAPHINTANVIEATRRALAKAGYDLEV
jgi:Hemerythrin HHE cation binding domain